MVNVRLVLAGLAASLAAAPAVAADVGYDPVYTPPAAATNYGQSSDWSGPYVGVLGSYSFGSFDSGQHVNGPTGGLYGGFNQQFGKGVYGIEMDGVLSGVDGSSGGVTADVDWMSTLRLRAGHAKNSFLFYGTGGLGVAGGKLSGGGGSDRETHLGWTLGAGVEASLSPRLTGRLEYLYSNFGDKTYSVGPTKTGFDLHSLRVGVGVKF